MAKITKEDVKKAFLNNKKRRTQLLYEYYKDEYFSHRYGYDFIAEKISEDLGIPVTRAMITLLYSRLINKQKAALASIPVSTTSAVDTFPGKQVIKEEKKVDTEKVQPTPEKKYVFSDNRKDLTKNEYMEAYLEREALIEKEEEEKRQQEENKKNQGG